jgi:hypothetical protein
MTGTQRKTRQSLKVRRSGGSWRPAWMRGAGELPTGSVRMTEPDPVESLPAPGRRRSGWQGTAVREEVEQPMRKVKGGASFGSLRMTQTDLQKLQSSNSPTRASFDIASEINARIALSSKSP